MKRDKTKENIGTQEQSIYTRNKLFFQDELEDLEIEDDIILVFGSIGGLEIEAAITFTAYKKVDRKVKPVSGTFPQNALVQ